MTFFQPRKVFILLYGYFLEGELFALLILGLANRLVDDIMLGPYHHLLLHDLKG